MEVRPRQQQPDIGLTGFRGDDGLEYLRGSDGIASIEEHRRPAELGQQIVHRGQSTGGAARHPGIGHETIKIGTDSRRFDRFPAFGLGYGPAAMKDLLLTWRLRRRAAAVFGWRTLRPAQLVAMRALLRGRDAMVILPTGAGKSAVYQVPATLLRGPTVVISPLLALQHDQIAGLDTRGHAMTRAVRVSSAESAKQQQQNLDAVRAGTARFLFITPEQLAQPERLAAVRALRPALVAVDEAHCLSSWGHDFRPDYLTLGEMLAQLAPAKGKRKGRRPVIVALTATASPPVRDDIATRLRLKDPQTVITGLDRPNLFLEASNCPTEDYRWRRLLALLTENSGCGIVYVPTRRQAEELAGRLREAGHRADYYHGGMSPAVRTRPAPGLPCRQGAGDGRDVRVRDGY